METFDPAILRPRSLMQSAIVDTQQDQLDRSGVLTFDLQMPANIYRAESEENVLPQGSLLSLIFSWVDIARSQHIHIGK